MQLRFDGLGAGMGFRSPSGDRNDPANYTLHCRCGLDLGPLARFTLKDGIRRGRCPQCKHAAVIRGTQIVGMMTPEEVTAFQLAQDQERLATLGGRALS